MKWFKQESGSICFCVALMNACRYKRKRIPNLSHLVRITKTKRGGAMNCEQGIKYAKLPLVMTNYYEDVLERDGILTLFHPIFNLHATFCFRRRKKYYLVNSWLGPTLISLSRKEFEKYIWNTNVAYHWCFQERIMKK